MTRFRVALAAFIIVVLTVAVLSTQRGGNVADQAAAEVTTTVPVQAPVSAPETLPDPTTTNAPPEPTTTVTEPPTTVAAPTTTVYVPPPTTKVPPTTAPVPKVVPNTTPAPRASSGDDAFLACVRQRESGSNYQAANPSGAAGAYQLMPATARNTASHAGRPDLASRSVLSWSPADQDAMARHLLAWQGRTPWAGGQYPC